jgi:hypothetical protein
VLFVVIVSQLECWQHECLVERIVYVVLRRELRDIAGRWHSARSVRSGCLRIQCAITRIITLVLTYRRHKVIEHQSCHRAVVIAIVIDIANMFTRRWRWRLLLPLLLLLCLPISDSRQHVRLERDRRLVVVVDRIACALVQIERQRGHRRVVIDCRMRVDIVVVVRIADVIVVVVVVASALAQHVLQSHN